MQSTQVINHEPLFGGEFFRDNRQSLLERLPDSGVVVVSAHTRMQRNRDNNYPFRQDSSFWYLTGVSEPDLLLVYCKAEAFLIAPTGRHDSYEAFEGILQADEVFEQSGGLELVDHRVGWRRLKQLANKHGIVYIVTPSPSYIRTLGLQTNSGSGRALASMRRRLPSSIQYRDIRVHLNEVRLVKQPEELAAIQKAIDITSQAFQTLDNEPLRSETATAALLRYEFERCGATEAYPSIVAGGKNACTLHYSKNNQSLQAGDLLLIDAGAEVSLYAADITRTFAVGDTEVSARAKEVQAAVITLQKQALDLFRVGRTLRDIEQAFEPMMLDALIQLGLTSAQRPDMLRQYYPHRLSHFLGLDVHDVGSDRTPLSEGMVMTIEPGIYIAEEAIGVRIEDDIVIKSGGAAVLSEACPRNLNIKE